MLAVLNRTSRYESRAVPPFVLGSVVLAIANRIVEAHGELEAFRAENLGAPTTSAAGAPSGGSAGGTDPTDLAPLTSL